MPLRAAASQSWFGRTLAESGETVLLNPAGGVAVLLDPGTARVLTYCDGTTTRRSVASLLGMDPDRLEQALTELGTAGLLEPMADAGATPISTPVGGGVSRRRVLAGAAVLGGTGVIMVGLPAAAAAASGGAGGGSDYAWGDNGHGQIGDGTYTNRAIPVAITLPAGVTLTSVAGGADHSLGVAITGFGYSWGINTYGQLGDGTTTSRLTPGQVSLPAGVALTHVAAGGLHSLGIGSGGTAYAWGYNGLGQLGDGTTTSRSTPVAVALPTGVTLTDVAAGAFHSLGISINGTAYAWGNNANGQLGDGTTTSRSTPVAVALPTGVTLTAVAAGNSHSLGIGSNGITYAWGANNAGQLGDGTATSRSKPVAVSLPMGVTLTSVAAGNAHSLGSNGNVYAWGNNFFGQLGDGTTTTRLTPVRVALPAGVTLTHVAAGNAHSLGA